MSNAFVAPTAVKTANYTAEAGDFVPVDTTGGVVTVTLPYPASDRAIVGVKLVKGSSTLTVQVSGSSSDTFNDGGGTSFTTTTLNQGVVWQYSEVLAVWYALSGDVSGGGGGFSSPMTTLGDLIYENSTPAAARLAGSTSATKNFLTQTGTGSVSAAPAWGTIASADMPTGTTSAKGALQLDGTAADILADGVQAAGGNGLAADSGHVHPNNAALSMLYAPSGATAETITRRQASADSGSLASGTLYVFGIGLPTGVAVSNITFFVNTTAASSPTHGWYVLLDSGLVVRAVSADQGSTNVWTPAHTKVTLSVAGSSYTTTYTGLYYVGVMIAATTPPSFAQAPNITNSGITGISPVINATSSTGQTTAPATSTTMGALTAFNASLYAYTS